MRTLSVTALIAVASLFVACGGAGNQQTPASGGAPSGSVEITFTSEPDPPRMGENAFDVMVMSGGQPVTDAAVSVEFFMPAMPAMNMPEMRNSVPLKHEGGGRYRGTGNVMMAGVWDATVSVTRGGQEVGSQKFSVTAK